ncbi:hypothetical protein [Sinorhizobium fredii]|uniref:hypothetical protein n=1 Tax=Rhizobium fredii TaxID=380 RepID=UPI00351590A5
MARLLTIHILEEGDRRISGTVAQQPKGGSHKLTPFEAAAIWQLAAPTAVDRKTVASRPEAEIGLR